MDVKERGGKEDEIRKELEKLGVITSYSIHYTKLYDKGSEWGNSKLIRFILLKVFTVTFQRSAGVFTR